MNEASWTTAPNGDRIRDNIAVFAHKTDYNRFSRILIATVDYRGNIVAMAKPFEFEPNDDPGGYISQSTIEGPMANEFLQAALETAWAMGLRPKDWRLETTEQVAAMNNHLQDMRKLVFGQPDRSSIMETLRKAHPDVS